MAHVDKAKVIVDALEPEDGWFLLETHTKLWVLATRALTDGVDEKHLHYILVETLAIMQKELGI